MLLSILPTVAYQFTINWLGCLGFKIFQPVVAYKPLLLKHKKCRNNVHRMIIFFKINISRITQVSHKNKIFCCRVSFKYLIICCKITFCIENRFNSLICQMFSWISWLKDLQTTNPTSSKTVD